MKNKIEDEIMCVCGDSQECHVDGCEQCVVPECGCKEFEVVCEYCGGTGEVAVDEDDGEGHMQKGVRIQKCICQLD